MTFFGHGSLLVRGRLEDRRARLCDTVVTPSWSYRAELR